LPFDCTDSSLERLRNFFFFFFSSCVPPAQKYEFFLWLPWTSALLCLWFYPLDCLFFFEYAGRDDGCGGRSIPPLVFGVNFFSSSLHGKDILESISAPHFLSFLPRGELVGLAAEIGSLDLAFQPRRFCRRFLLPLLTFFPPLSSCPPNLPGR